MTSQALELSRNRTVPHDVRYLAAEVAGLANSGLVPAALRGKPDDVLLVALTGRELGLPGLNSSMQNIHVINGTPTLSAALCVARALAAGHEVWSEEETDTTCTVAGNRRNRPDRITRITWTIARAKRAGLLNNPNWQKYPEAMLYRRASKDLVRRICPEVMMGLDDGRHFDDIPGAPVEHEPGDADAIVAAARRNASQAAITDDEITDAELVPTPAAPLEVEDWPSSWMRRIKAAGLGRTESIRIINDVSKGAASDSGTLHPDLRPAADATLTEVIASLDGAA